jgi:glycosyltransferase involved in cell wall biosynthesis
MGDANDRQPPLSTRHAIGVEQKGRGHGMSVPRIAFFTDSFHEVNGVAHTSRMVEAFARDRGYPFLSAHAGPLTRRFEDGSVTRVELRRGIASFGVERDFGYDLLHWRHLGFVKKALREFRPDLVHITGPGDMGQLGAYAAHALRIPTVASWHTNLHEYAGGRLRSLLTFLPSGTAARLGEIAEAKSLELIMWFYQVGRVVFAPNEELQEFVREKTGKPVYLMRRGVDTELFTPEKRQRPAGSEADVIRLGYVGRLATEKNVRLLVDLERALIAAGRKYEFVIVGDGRESDWLRAKLQRAHFAGILRGEALAQAYADMDLFVFPSHTDTFGNVVLEAMASGVPVVVTVDGGPKFLVLPGINGMVARDDDDFIKAVVAVSSPSDLLAPMRKAARQAACRASWDAVLEGVYRVYTTALETQPRRWPAGSAPSNSYFDKLEIMRD